MIGVVLEGVVGAGKSSVFGLLQRLLQRRAPAMTKLFVSEHYTDRMRRCTAGDGNPPLSPLEHSRTMTSWLETLEHMLRDSEFRDLPGRADSIVVLERFLLSEAMRLPQHHERIAVVAHGAAMAELAALGFRQVVLRVPPEQLHDRIVSTVEHRNDAWREYLARHGGPNAQVDHYRRRQDELLELAQIAARHIPTRVIEVRTDEYASAAQEVLSWIVPRGLGKASPTSRAGRTVVIRLGHGSRRSAVSSELQLDLPLA